jgi:hypothetical protein
MDSAVAQFGIGINGNSFENSAITTFNGWQYTAYWVKDGSTYHVAIARRPTGSANWQLANLGASSFVNGMSSGKPSDAHNVVSLGIDEIDGTIHIAYDMHVHNLRYRATPAGVATNPNAISSASWTTQTTNGSIPLFNSETSALVGSTTITSVTYPHFINTPSGGLQFTYRRGSSGNGSNWLADYSSSSHLWSNVHQYDNGATGTYTGTVTIGDPNRNSYINGATYGPSGRLYQSFTWREGATGAANHDINFVYSDDNGSTWLNNAGTVVGNNIGATFNLNSPGLIVVPLDESQSLMNQQTQAVSGNSAATERFHAIMWHRDQAKTTSLSGVYVPTESSYFHYWRDSLGNFHRNKLPGAVGTRPKLFFDSNDNALAIYQVGTFSSAGIYINNGDLAIAAATKATNWTDWKIIKVETGPFASEAAADAKLLAGGTLSVIMQESPTVITPAQGTNLRALDYSIALTSAAVGTFTAASADWDVPGNWNGSSIPGTNKVVYINNGRSARVDQAVPTLDNLLIVGGAGSAGTLNVVSGGSLNLLSSGLLNSTYGGSIIVGRDGGFAGTYMQSGGTVNAWRFAVGDFFSETSGGGASSATISGGTLNVSELNVAFSANGSSSGSSFNVAGGAVSVNGDAILSDCGNNGSITLSSGTLQIAGELREGYNQTNTSNLRMNGGGLDMTGGAITVDNFIYNGGALQNLSTIATQSLSGVHVGTLLVGRDAGTTMSVPASVRVGASNRVETWAGSTLSLGSAASVAIGTTPTFTANQVTITAGGTLAGDGTITSPVNNSGGVVAPGHSIGALKINSTFAQNAWGRIDIELGNGGSDAINITGVASLAGTMRVSTFGSVPLPGQSFDVLTFASRTGDVILDNQTGYAGLIFNKSYSTTKLTLLASAKYMGDANLDGVVNSADFNALASSFNQVGNWLTGDFNADGFVNALDFNALASNLGAGTAAPALGSVVPEPSCMAFLAAGALLARRRRYSAASNRRLLRKDHFLGGP